MTHCPQCGKHLLSQASARCNWCGAAIDDADYQAHAQAERNTYFAHAAAHDAQSLAATEALFILNTPIDPFTRAPMPSRRQMLSVTATDILPPAPSTTSARMPARKIQPPQASAGQAQTDSGATDEPIRNEAEQAGERFRHLEL